MFASDQGPHLKWETWAVLSSIRCHLPAHVKDRDGNFPSRARPQYLPASVGAGVSHTKLGHGTKWHVRERFCRGFLGLLL